MCLYAGHHRSFANKDFHDNTQSGKVGPVWNADKSILEVQFEWLHVHLVPFDLTTLFSPDYTNSLTSIV